MPVEQLTRFGIVGENTGGQAVREVDQFPLALGPAVQVSRLPYD